jgi:hypothetical protein
MVPFSAKLNTPLASFTLPFSCSSLFFCIYSFFAPCSPSCLFLIAPSRLFSPHPATFPATSLRCPFSFLCSLLASHSPPFLQLPHLCFALFFAPMAHPYSLLFYHLPTYLPLLYFAPSLPLTCLVPYSSLAASSSSRPSCLCHLLTSHSPFSLLFTPLGVFNLAENSII